MLRRIAATMTARQRLLESRHPDSFTTRAWHGVRIPKGAKYPRIIWEFPKIGGSLFWGPDKKNPTIWGTRVPYSLK